MTTDHGTTLNGQGTEDMQRAIERLRASREKSDQKAREDGSRAGRAWAMKTAEAVELERLERLSEQTGDDWDGWFTEDVSAYSLNERFYFVLRPHEDGERRAARSFWEGDIDSDNPNFVRGFAEGALEFWEEVKAKL